MRERRTKQNLKSKGKGRTTGKETEKRKTVNIRF